MKEIPLTQGKIAMVDDEDFEELNQYNWYAVNNCGRGWYARRNSARDANGKQHAIFMHRQVANAQPGEWVDHKDTDGLNNQRENLRPCTTSQNSANAKKRVNCSSIYKGVWWNKRPCKWQAQIMVNYKRIHLGYFDDEIEAALAYNAAAQDAWGEFARVNIIEEI